MRIALKLDSTLLADPGQLPYSAGENDLVIEYYNKDFSFID